MSGFLSFCTRLQCADLPKLVQLGQIQIIYSVVRINMEGKLNQTLMAKQLLISWIFHGFKKRLGVNFQVIYVPLYDSFIISHIIMTSIQRRENQPERLEIQYDRVQITLI